MDKIESTLAKYLEFRTFELFKNQFLPAVIPHCRQDSKEDIYQHLFLCPSTSSKKRSFKLSGVLSPFVCMWRTGALTYNSDFYARSVLQRSFEYTKKDGTSNSELGYLYDLKFTVELFSSSYYKSFRDRVNQDILDMDRIRYFDIDLKEMLTDCREFFSKAEFMLKGINLMDNEENEKNRSFDLKAEYEVKITVPYCRSEKWIDTVNLYLNENQIYSHSVDPYRPQKA